MVLQLSWKRKQFVTIDNVSSDTRIIKCGVPQGSILGVLLLILYVNDIVNVSQLVNRILFADDTNVFNSDNDLTSLIVKANDELSKLSLSKLSLSFRVNRLSLNVKKTNFISFRTKNKCMPENVKINIDGVDISRVTSTKFVGVIINETLTWDDNMKLIYNKISKSIELYEEYHTIFLHLFSCLYIIRWYIYIMSNAISFGLMSNRNILKNCQHLSVKSCV